MGNSPPQNKNQNQNQNRLTRSSLQKIKGINSGEIEGYKKKLQITKIQLDGKVAVQKRGIDQSIEIEGLMQTRYECEKILQFLLRQDSFITDLLVKMREKNSIEIDLALNQNYPGFSDQETRNILYTIQEQRRGSNNMTNIRNQMNFASKQSQMNKQIDEYYTQYNLIRPDN